MRARGLSEEEADKAALAALFSACNGRWGGHGSHEAAIAILDRMGLDVATSLE